MLFTRDGTADFRTIIPQGWGASRAVNAAEDGAPEVPAPVPGPMEHAQYGGLPVPVQEPQAAMPPAATNQSGVILEEGRAQLLGEIFRLTPEELAQLAEILIRAYERVQESKVQAFRQVHIVPAAPRRTNMDLSTLHNQGVRPSPAEQEHAGAMLSMWASSDAGQSSVREMLGAMEGIPSQAPGARSAISRQPSGEGDPTGLSVRDLGTESVHTPEDWRLPLGGQDQPEAGLREGQLPANIEVPEHTEGNRRRRARRRAKALNAADRASGQ